MAIILDGTSISSRIRADIILKTAEIKEKYGIVFCIAVVQVGDNLSSNSYIKNNIKVCKSLGIETKLYKYDITVNENELISCIKKINEDDNINGILVQFPLPSTINEHKIANAINPLKDIDGINPLSAGNLFLGKTTLVPNTASGVMELIKATNVNLCGKNAVVIGRSNIVGKPLAILLLNENCTVTICHSKTVNLKEKTLNADILISAVGHANFVTKDMVNLGAIVIDVGINFLDGKLVGDVDFDEVAKVASYITPVPGGCGPMTVTMLSLNTLKAGLIQKGLKL